MQDRGKCRINLGLAVVGTLDFAGNARVQGSNIDMGGYEQ
jgi:hypothetical protein